jgi:transcriptional regulator with XRE-family HTH domain
MKQEEDFLRELADQIKQARHHAGKSQLEVLQETGIHVGRIEMGEHSISVITLHRLCIYLNVCPKEIFQKVEMNLPVTYLKVIGGNKRPGCL